MRRRSNGVPSAAAALGAPNAAGLLPRAAGRAAGDRRVTPPMQPLGAAGRLRAAPAAAVSRRIPQSRPRSQCCSPDCQRRHPKRSCDGTARRRDVCVRGGAPGRIPVSSSSLNWRVFWMSWSVDAARMAQEGRSSPNRGRLRPQSVRLCSSRARSCSPTRDGRAPHVAGSADVARGPWRQVTEEGAGVESVAWEHQKRERG